MFTKRQKGAVLWGAEEAGKTAVAISYMEKIS